MQEVNGQPAGPEGGSDGLAGFMQPHPISGGVGRDAALMRRAIEEDWDVPAEKRPRLVARMFQVVERESVDIPIGDGSTFSSVAVADRNAIAAAGLIRDLVTHNQRDRHEANRLLQDDKHLQVDRTRILLEQLARRYHEQGKVIPPMLREYLPADCR